jgi:hypothetical protein
VENVPYSAVLSFTGMPLSASEPLALSPNHATLRYAAVSDCMNKDEVVFRADAHGRLTPAADLPAEPVWCTFSVAVRASDYVAMENPFGYFAMRVGAGNPVLYLSSQPELQFQRMEARLDRTFDNDLAVGTPAEVALTLIAPLQQGDLLFLQFPPEAALSLRTAKGFTTAACAEDASLAIVEPRSPSRLQIRLLRDAPSFACTFTVTPNTPVSRSAPALVLSVPRYGAALELPSPLVTADPSRTLDVHLHSMPLQLMPDAVDLDVALLPAASDAADLVFAVPYVYEIRSHRPAFATECLSGDATVARVEADVPRFLYDPTGATGGAYATLLRLTFPAGAYKPRSQGPTTCTVKLHINDANRLYFLRPEGPDGDVEMTVPYGTIESGPIMPQGAIELLGEPGQRDMLVFKLPWGPTAAKSALRVSGVTFADRQAAEAALSFQVGTDPVTRYFDVAVDADGVLTLALKPTTERVSLPKLFLELAEPVPALAVQEVSGAAPLTLAAFNSPWADAEVTVTSAAAAVVGVAGMETSWTFAFNNLVTKDREFVELALPLALQLSAVDAACSQGASLTLLPPSAPGFVRLLLQGPSDAGAIHCDVKATSAASETAKPAIARAWLSTWDQNPAYTQVRVTSAAPAVLAVDDFSFTPLAPALHGAPADWRFSFGVFSTWDSPLAEGDVVTFATSEPLANAGDTVSCVHQDSSAPAFSCLVAEKELRCTALPQAASPCVLSLTSAAQFKAQMALTATVAQHTPSDAIPAGFTVTLPPVPVYPAALAVEGDALRAGRRVAVTLRASVEALPAGSVLEVRWSASADAPLASLALYDEPCVPAPGEDQFCTASVAPGAGYTALLLTMLGNAPQAGEVTISLPLYFGVTGALPESVSLWMAGEALTAPAPVTGAASPIRQATLSAVADDPARDQVLLLEAACVLDGAVTVQGLVLPEGTTEVPMRNCGTGGVDGVAYVGADGITISDAAVVVEEGSTCVLLLPGATTASSAWLTVSTLYGTAEFLSARPAHDVTVTPPAAIVSWVEYPLRFEFPRLQLAAGSDRLFAFTSNANAAFADVACTLAAVPGGSPEAIDVTIATAASPDPAHPYNYLVNATAAPDSGDHFLALDCVVSLRLEGMPPGADYSLLVTAIGREDIANPSSHPLGKPQAEPQPAITLEAAGTLQLDLVITQLELLPDAEITVAAAEGVPALFTFITCEGRITPLLSDSGLLFEVTEYLPLSIVPRRVRCTAALVDEAMGTAISFPSHPEVPARGRHRHRQHRRHRRRHLRAAAPRPRLRAQRRQAAPHRQGVVLPRMRRPRHRVPVPRLRHLMADQGRARRYGARQVRLLHRV